MYLIQHILSCWPKVLNHSTFIISQYVLLAPQLATSVNPLKISRGSWPLF